MTEAHNHVSELIQKLDVLPQPNVHDFKLYPNGIYGIAVTLNNTRCLGMGGL